MKRAGPGFESFALVIEIPVYAANVNVNTRSEIKARRKREKRAYIKKLLCADIDAAIQFAMKSHGVFYSFFNNDPLFWILTHSQVD